MELRRTAFVSLVAALVGCAGPTGDLTVLLEAEDTVRDGLAPGEGREDVVDGWQVEFTKYLVAIGDVHLGRSGDGAEAHAHEVYVVDLAGVGANGVEIARFEGLAAERWDRFEYATPHPEGAIRHESASAADFDAMVQNDWTYLIEGRITKADGQSCPPGAACRPATSIAFRFGASVETVFGPCQAEEGLPGVVVTESGTTAAITLHGDHVFFDGFPSGAEVIARRAQWLADADTNGDARVDGAELAAIPVADLYSSDFYNLAGAPLELETAWDYVRGQLATQGHFQGEGECPWNFEGRAGGHDHE